MLLVPDAGHTADVARTFQVTLDGLGAGLTFSRSLDIFTSTYDLNTHNCVDAAIQAAAACGISLPDTYQAWPLGGGGSNPGDFGEDLRGMR
jgi:hypothetical protein